jgi:hydrogenase maturation protein HypF
LSHHLGDLDHYETYKAYGEAIDHYEHLFGVPGLIVHDLHPEYASTRYAHERMKKNGVPCLAVQHHHAHLASCMAEQGLDEPVIGVIFDGAGLGTDGAIWGGEFLVGDYRSFHRAAHLRYVPMPGGERAVREPWRMALAHVLDAKLPPDLIGDHVDDRALATVGRMIKRRVNAPLTSSIGRLFDAVAALAGIRQNVSYEGQAAIELEWRASESDPDGSYPFDLVADEGNSAKAAFQIDTRPLIAALTKDVHNKLCCNRIARRFHSTVVEIIVQTCRRIREQSGLNRVVLSGGVFMNALLLGEALEQLKGNRFDVHRHQRVPPNDGGLCLGQLAIAAATAGDDHFQANRRGEANVPGDPR